MILIIRKNNEVFFRLDDSVDDPIGTGSNCYLCEHSTNHRICNAFGRIPDEIWYGRVQHTKPYPGDNGIMFEPIK